MSTAAQLAEMQARLVAQSSKVKGYLDKKSGNVFVGYQQRYFLVLDNFVIYFKDESLIEQKGKINIYNFKEVQKVGDNELTIDIGDRVYSLRASDEATRDDWVGCLNILQEYYQLGGQLSAQSQSMYFSRWKQLAGPHFSRKPTEPESEQDRLYRSIFKELSLNLLYQDFCLPIVKNRLVIHKFKEGFYFAISCKSLVADYDDELILPKDYIEPLDFNMLYAYQRETGQPRKLFSTDLITSVGIVDTKYLRINQLLLTFNGGIQEFTEKLKISVGVGKEYFNQLGLKLNKNIDMTLKIYDESKTSFDKSQKLKTKFEIQYNELLEQYDKSYRKQYTSFSKLLQRLLTQITDFINACRVRPVFRVEVVKMYVEFMHNKIYMLLRNFWNDNHEMILNINILKLANWTMRYDKLLHAYIKDERLINGTKILIDIFFRNANEQVIQQIQQIYSNAKFFELSVANCTKLPFQLCKSIQSRTKLIIENFDITEVIDGIQQLLKRALSTAVDCVLNISSKQRSVQFLAALCNDVWIYKKDLSMINYMKVEHVDRWTLKMHTGIVKRIVTLLINQIETKDVLQYCNELLRLIRTVKDLNSASMTQLHIHSVRAVNNIYLTSMVMRRPIGDKVLEQISADLPKFEKVVAEAGQHWQPLLTVPNCISRIMTSQSNSAVLQACLELNQLIDNLLIADLRYLLGVSKGAGKDNVDKMTERVFEKKDRAISAAESISSDIYNSYHPRSMQPRDLLPPRQSTLTMSLSNVTKSQLDGYLQFKDFLSKAYKQRFFRFNDCCLKWYHSATSHQLINRIQLCQINKLELYPQSTKFKIEKRDGTVFKFKASSQQSASKWVDQLNRLMALMEGKKGNTKTSQDQEMLFKDYFTASECSVEEESRSQRLLSAMSMVSTDRNRQESDYRLMLKSRQPEPEVKMEKKKSWFRLGCLGFQ